MSGCLPRGASVYVNVQVLYYFYYYETFAINI